MLPVYLYGHPVLRKVAEDITPEYPDLQDLIKNMWQSMYDSDGIGLAAPQIGRSIRLLVIDASPMASYYPECADFKTVMINAHITRYSEETCSEEEGCLSLPGIHENVVRPREITIAYLDENFQPQERTFAGFAARVVQHEYDHLEGKLFVDHIGTMRKSLIKNKLSRIASGKVSPGYPTIAAPKKK